MNARYGTPTSIGEFCKKAQLLNIETNKAMYEGWLDNLWNDASGLIIWMSQSAYPSMVWQTYDYYFDATGAYWGAKKACEPVHIQYNPVTHAVKIINTTTRALQSVTAEAKIFRLDGSEIAGLRKTRAVTVGVDTLHTCFTLAPPVNDLAFGKPAYASSVHVGSREADKAFDGNDKSRWESDFSSQPWIVVDLGETQPIGRVRLVWEGAYAKTYKVQVSADAVVWKDVFTTAEGGPGPKEIAFPTVDARYVRMYCIEKGTSYGVSLYTMEVFGDAKNNLSDVHLITLSLRDASGRTLSDNLYWRSMKQTDYTGLNALPAPALKTTVTVSKNKGAIVLRAVVANTAQSPAIAFAVHAQLKNSRTGERVLPAIFSDNYFTLLKGESKTITVEVAAEQLGADAPLLTLEPYNSHK